MWAFTSYKKGKEQANVEEQDMQQSKGVDQQTVPPIQS